MTDAPTKIALTDEEVGGGRHHGEPQERHCLRCRVAFHSEWAGERICARCKSSTTWRSGVPVRPSPAKSGR